MHNPYLTKLATITKIIEQTSSIKLFRFKFGEKNFKINSEHFHFKPGQFAMLSLPGFGESPFAPCNQLGNDLELCVRVAGRLTNKLHSLRVGDKVGIRGPYGNGWPIRQPAELKKNVLIVVGGLGLIPLRTLILGKKEFFGKDARIQIFYGAKHPSEMLFRNEYKEWEKSSIDLQLTIDKTCPEWQGCIGLVTKLFNVAPIIKNAKAFLCGPPVMYKGVLEKLKENKFSDEDIYLSFERRMHCGVGICQHCGVGPHYTCKQGPVFKYSAVKGVSGAI